VFCYGQPLISCRPRLSEGSGSSMDSEFPAQAPLEEIRRRISKPRSTLLPGVSSRTAARRLPAGHRGRIRRASPQRIRQIAEAKPWFFHGEAVERIVERVPIPEASSSHRYQYSAKGRRQSCRSLGQFISSVLRGRKMMKAKIRRCRRRLKRPPISSVPCLSSWHHGLCHDPKYMNSYGQRRLGN